MTAADAHPAEPLTLATARDRMRAWLTPVATLDRVAVHAALGRILGADVVTDRAMPACADGVAQGATVLAAGHRIQAADLGLLASIGRVEVPVRRRLRAAFFSTGDGLRSLGEPLGEGEIYDSNRYMLYGMLRQFGADTLDLGVVRDEPRALREAFEHAGADADVVITSGGVSIRSPAYVRDLLMEMGDIGFWNIRIKPGRPLPFGRLCSGALFFGLSSNPIPTSVAFHQVVRPALDRLAGAAPRAPLALTARCSAPLDAANGLRHFLRGRLTCGEDGVPEVSRAAPGMRGVTRVMTRANCFIVLPEDSGPIETDQMVRVEPFAALV